MSVEPTYLDTRGLRMHAGLTIFEIDHQRKGVFPAEYKSIDVEGKPVQMLVLKPGCDYECALNMKNAIKKYNKRK